MALAELKMEPHRVTIVSWIGCSAKTVHYVKTYGIHTLHGRALPYATGVKLANPQLKVLCLSGDGDGLGIGGGHFVNVGRPRLLVRYQASRRHDQTGDGAQRLRLPRRPPAVPDVQRPEHERVVRRRGPQGSGGRSSDASRLQARGRRLRPGGPRPDRGREEDDAGAREGARMGRPNPDWRLLPERTRADVRRAHRAARADVHGAPAGPPADRGPERRTEDGPDAAHAATDVQGRVTATRLASRPSSRTSAAGFPICQIRSAISDIASAIAGSSVQIAMSSPRYEESSSGIGWLMRNSLPSNTCM